MTKQYGMLIDMERCSGCSTCRVVCKAENNVPLGADMAWCRILTPAEVMNEFSTTKPKEAMPLQCMHCEDAPCVDVCPTGATYKRDDGIVAINYEECIGCQACVQACPYNARIFNEEEPEQIPSYDDERLGDAAVPARGKDKVAKCTFCMEKVDRGEKPACVIGCPTDARIFGDVNDPNSEISKAIKAKGGKRFLDELGTKPFVYYAPPRNY